MMAFFKPTKVKVILTILLLIMSALFYAYWISQFGTTLINWCLPNIPGKPIPTPEPISVSRTITDVTRLENPLPLGNYGDVLCMSGDRSAQLASTIVDISKIFAMVLYVCIIYIVTCTIIFLITNSGKQKTRQTVKSKK